MSRCWCIDQLHWLCLFGVSWALPPLQCRMWLWPTTFGMERGGGLAWKVLGQSGMLFCCVLCVAYGESGMLGVWFSWYLLLKTLLLSGPHWLFLFSALGFLDFLDISYCFSFLFNSFFCSCSFLFCVAACIQLVYLESAPFCFLMNLFTYQKKKKKEIPYDMVQWIPYSFF